MKEILEIFKESPKKDIPEQGGYCVYVLGVNGKKASIDSEN